LGRSVFFVIVVSALLGWFVPWSHGADWKPVGKDADDCQWFYDRWAYELGLMELDCKEATIRQLSVSDYDRNEKLLKSRAIGENVNSVTRDSIGEAVLNLICGSPVRDIEEIMPRFPAF